VVPRVVVVLVLLLVRVLVVRVLVVLPSIRSFSISCSSMVPI
jgi:hypothetical protein